MNRNLVLVVTSIIFVYAAFFISAMFSLMTFYDWVRMGMSSISDSDIANVQSIMDTLFYVPISLFSLHVVLVAIIYWRSIKAR
ncbi:hypothetical protein MW332_003091 [Vibrio parahaemolyticus]|nr:hypothetical protein [Vibrio parahaemolyticus]